MKQWVSGLAVLTTLIFSTALAYAQSQWRNLPKSSYPARVEAITFKSGLVLNAGNGGCWGSWCVYFGYEPPVAEWIDCSGSISFCSKNSGATIYGLECKNEVIGTVSCSMNLWYIGRGSEYWCAIRPVDREQFDIKCPKTLRLQ